MFFLGARLPISDELRQWVDGAFLRLEQVLGRERLLKAEVVLPNDIFFPDRYDGTEENIRGMAERVAGYMGIAPDTFVVHVYAENEDEWRKDLEGVRFESRDTAGLYFHELENGKYLIGIHANQREDPLSLVATLAHELAHVVLLGGGLIAHEAEDMEPMTDVCTAYLGMGFFTASVAFQFKKWSNERTEGWSTSRKGYLSQELWGYVLARFAAERAEKKPAWAKELPVNVRGYFGQSVKWLRENSGSE